MSGFTISISGFVTIRFINFVNNRQYLIICSHYYNFRNSDHDKKWFQWVHIFSFSNQVMWFPKPCEQFQIDMYLKFSKWGRHSVTGYNQDVCCHISARHTRARGLVRKNIHTDPELQWFDLQYFNLMMVRKQYAFSRNCTSNFEFRSFPRLTICRRILSGFAGQQQ